MRRRMRTPLTLTVTAALALPIALAAPAAQADERGPDQVSNADRWATVRAVADAAEAVADQQPDLQAPLTRTTPSPSGTGGWADRLAERRALNQSLEDAADGVPVGVTARLDSPTMHWRGADGLRELDRRAEARPWDVFRVASITKPMVATLVLQEVERGTWSLDTLVDDVLPGVLPAAVADKVTIEQLLSHRSGLPDHISPMVASRMSDPTDNDEFFEKIEEEFTAADHLEAISALPWQFEPGSDFLYSNAGYVLLGMALEKVTGRDLGRLLETRVFAAAGMWRTDFPDEPGTRGPFMVGAAHLGDIASGWYSLDGFDPSVFDAAGAVTSTTADLQRFTDALLDGTLLDRDTVEDMATPRTTDDPQLPEYGLGLYRLPDPCEPGAYLYGHDGATFGTLSMTLTSADREREYSVALTGRDYVAPATEIADVMNQMFVASC